MQAKQEKNFFFPSRFMSANKRIAHGLVFEESVELVGRKAKTKNSKGFFLSRKNPDFAKIDDQSTVKTQ